MTTTVVTILMSLQTVPKEAVQKMNTLVTTDSVFQKGGCVIATRIATMVVMREAVVIRHADQLSSPAQMANVSRKHGSVIMTISMIVEMDQMNSSAPTRLAMQRNLPAKAMEDV